MVTFLGFDGVFHSPNTGMQIRIDLDPEKKQLWAGGIRFFIDSGRAQAKELESLTGRLSFSQTSVFG